MDDADTDEDAVIGMDDDETEEMLGEESAEDIADDTIRDI